jgi:hypothetical protein
MSRDDRTGFVYSGDLYQRSWELERASSRGNLSLSESPSDQHQDQQTHQKYHRDVRHLSDNTSCVSCYILLKLVVCSVSVVYFTTLIQ